MYIKTLGETRIASNFEIAPISAVKFSMLMRFHPFAIFNMYQ